MYIYENIENWLKQAAEEEGDDYYDWLCYVEEAVTSLLDNYEKEHREEFDLN